MKAKEFLFVFALHRGGVIAANSSHTSHELWDKECQGSLSLKK